MNNDNTLVLAHYYTEPEVQQMADYVGDSLDLAQHAQREKPKRIVFAGVKFMAETAKILNPDTEIILPDSNSTCSLVEQTDVIQLKNWSEQYKDHTHIMYINSSAKMKAMADVIVTSRIVDDVVAAEYNKGNKVIFSPDRNMGAYLNYQYGYNMPTWTAVCEVHEKFKDDELRKAMAGWTNGGKYVLAHPESPLSVLKMADYIGSTKGMLDWVKKHPYNISTIFVATEEGLLYNMRQLRPDLDIRLAPTYTGCACNACPYMKMNKTTNVNDAIKYGRGLKIDYLSDLDIMKALKPIQKMMYYA
jgi:quinolinate synthase